jgi:flagellar motor switch/type III secretory pathway protein FliN
MSVEEVGAHLADLPIRLDFEMGKRRMRIADIVSLKPGSIIQFVKPAGGQLEMFAGGARIGYADINTEGDRVYIRLTAVQGQD